MTRLYGRAKIGDRVNDYVPDVRFKRQSILSTVGRNGVQAPMVFSGTLNGELFKKWVTDCLVPTLKEGDVVVMDKLSVHKVKGVIEPILACGAT